MGQPRARACALCVAFGDGGAGAFPDVEALSPAAQAAASNSGAVRPRPVPAGHLPSPGEVSGGTAARTDRLDHLLAFVFIGSTRLLCFARRIYGVRPVTAYPSLNASSPLGRYLAPALHEPATRIKRVLSWKKPAKIVCAAVLVLAVVPALVRPYDGLWPAICGGAVCRADLTMACKTVRSGDPAFALSDPRPERCGYDYAQTLLTLSGENPPFPARVQPARAGNAHPKGPEPEKARTNRLRAGAGAGSAAQNGSGCQSPSQSIFNRRYAISPALLFAA